MRSTFLKATTLSCFFILIAGFVAYRSDAFEPDAISDAFAVDSPNVERKDPTMFPSSKSAKIFKEREEFDLTDTTKNKKVVAKKKKDTISSFYMDDIMSSSKSGAIFIPEFTIDTAKTKQKNKEENKEVTPKVFLQEKNIMSSSKSLIIATPQTSTYTPIVFPKKK